MNEKTFAMLKDEIIEKKLFQLYQKADQQNFALFRHYLPKMLSYLLGKGFRWDNKNLTFYDDKYIPISPYQGIWLYLQARAIQANTIVEFGTSFGISTIFLAKAVKDNGGGTVIGTEMVKSKIKAAKKNLQDAGISEYTSILEGDARLTLQEIEKPVDMLIVDGFPNYALDILKIVSPKLRKGAIVIADNINTFKSTLTGYLDYLQNSENGFITSTLPFKDGTEFSVKV
ncbi:MAG: class I SAM-dependent methyltransferase [Spirochaetota bacterium]